MQRQHQLPVAAIEGEAPRQRVNGGVSSDHTKEMVIFQASSCAQLSGLPIDAVYTCAPAALRKASTVHSTKPMAQTRPHCFNMVSYLILR